MKNVKSECYLQLVFLRFVFQIIFFQYTHRIEHNERAYRSFLIVCYSNICCRLNKVNVECCKSSSLQLRRGDGQDLKK